MPVPPYRLRAFRRGRGVVIEGFIPQSDQPPFLERVPETRPDTRTFKLRYRSPVEAKTQTPPPVFIEHLEPEIPDHVRRLRFLLPDDREVIIVTRRGQGE